MNRNENIKFKKKLLLHPGKSFKQEYLTYIHKQIFCQYNLRKKMSFTSF